MEGSHQKGSNWYGCQYVYRRGLAAADAAGHPRVLGINEENVLDPLFEFLGRRIFGPDRLFLLREELSGSVADKWREHEDDLARLRRELADLERALTGRRSASTR